MNKTIYLIRGGNTESYTAFTSRALEIAGRVAGDDKPEALWLTVTAEAPPKLSVIPFRKNKVAAISIIRESMGPIGTLMAADGFAGAYLVSEALPVAYQKTWPDGQPTPGVCLLTLFRQKKTIDYDTFIDRWHNGHTPLSLRLHPLWHYNRNVIEKTVAGDSEVFDGIVEEHFRQASDLLNPARFFGNPLTMFYHMLEVYLDTVSFLDYGSIEPYLVREYHLVDTRSSLSH